MKDDVELFDVVEVADVLAAGTFSTWLGDTRAGLKSQRGADVPCADCTACCRSSYFIHIAPEESETLDHIPDDLLFAAPGKGKGHLLLGYDENGCCPMLLDDKCSIYQYRPQTCRNFDCRIFPAAGISAGGGDKTLVAKRALRWKFDYPDERDRVQHSAVIAAAQFLFEHADKFADDVPRNPTQLAVLALKVHEVFLDLENKDVDTLAESELVSALKDKLQLIGETGQKGELP